MINQQLPLHRPVSVVTCPIGYDLFSTCTCLSSWWDAYWTALFIHDSQPEQTHSLQNNNSLFIFILNRGCQTTSSTVNPFYMYYALRITGTLIVLAVCVWGRQFTRTELLLVCGQAQLLFTDITGLEADEIHAACSAIRSISNMAWCHTWSTQTIHCKKITIHQYLGNLLWQLLKSAIDKYAITFFNKRRKNKNNRNGLWQKLKSSPILSK